MMRKVLILVITLAMLASLGVAVMAEEPANPVLLGDDDFPAMIALEKAQVDTSQGLPEQALIENDCAEKRLEALRHAKEQIGDDEFGQEVLKELMSYLEEGEGNLGLIIAQMAQEKGDSEGSDNKEVLENITNNSKERGWRLKEIVEDEEMPAGARAGAERALANMEAAAEKAAWARGEGNVDGNEGPPGPPPWAGAGEKGEENSANSSEVAPKTEENPAEVTLPDEALTEEAPPEETPPVEVPEGEDNDENGPPEGVPANGAPAERSAGGPPER